MELYGLHFSSNIIRVIQPKKRRLAGHVVGIGDGRCAYRVLVTKHKGRSHLKNHSVDEIIILK
jgi:hypothetical protein